MNQKLLFTLVFSGCNVLFPESGTRMISHTQIHQAVQTLNNPEMLDWVESPDDYATKLQPFQGISAHALYQITPSHTSHPMSFYLAAKNEDSYVVSGNIAGFAALVRAEPALLTGEDAGKRIVELLCELPDTCTFIEDGAALRAIPLDVSIQIAPVEIDQTAQGWQIQLFLIDDIQRLQRWNINIPLTGKPVFKRTTLAQNVMEKGQ